MRLMAAAIQWALFSCAAKLYHISRYRKQIIVETATIVCVTVESIFNKLNNVRNFSHTTGNNQNYGTTLNPKTTQKTHEGWVGVAGKPCDLKTPAHSNIYSQLCVRNTFSASFVPQPAENHTSLFCGV